MLGVENLAGPDRAARLFPLAAEEDGCLEQLLAPRLDGVAQAALEAESLQGAGVHPAGVVLDHFGGQAHPGQVDHGAAVVEADRQPDLEEVADTFGDHHRAGVDGDPLRLLGRREFADQVGERVGEAGALRVQGAAAVAPAPVGPMAVRLLAGAGGQHQGEGPGDGEDRRLGQAERGQRGGGGLVSLAVDPHLGLHGAGDTAVEDPDTVEPDRLQVGSEGVGDLAEHVRLHQCVLETEVLLVGEPIGQRARADGPPSRHTVLVVGAAVVGELLMRVEQLKQAGAGGTGPEAGRVARGGDHHHAVHEAGHVGLDAHVREGDQVVVPVVPVPRRSDSDGPTLGAFERVALEFGARRAAGGDLLQGVADQGEEVEIGQSARGGLGAARATAYPGHAGIIRRRFR